MYLKLRIKKSGILVVVISDDFTRLLTTIDLHDNLFIIVLSGNIIIMSMPIVVTVCKMQNNQKQLKKKKKRFRVVGGARAPICPWLYGIDYIIILAYLHIPFLSAFLETTPRTLITSGIVYSNNNNDNKIYAYQLELPPVASSLRDRSLDLL